MNGKHTGTGKASLLRPAPQLPLAPSRGMGGSHTTPCGRCHRFRNYGRFRTYVRLHTCSRCHRFRTACSVRPSSCKAIVDHLGPTFATLYRMRESSYSTRWPQGVSDRSKARHIPWPGAPVRAGREQSDLFRPAVPLRSVARRFNGTCRLLGDVAAGNAADVVALRLTAPGALVSNLHRPPPPKGALLVILLQRFLQPIPSVADSVI
jgi:hypothetical protein